MEENKDQKIDYLTVLIESMKSDFKVFGEGQRALREKVDVMEVKVDSLVDDMDFVKSEIVEIKDRFKEVDAELGKKADKEVTGDHETRIASLENTALAKA